MTCITNHPRRHYIGVSVGGALDASTAITRKLAVVSNNHVWTPTYTEDDSHRGSPWFPSEGVVYDKGAGSGPVTLRPRADDFTAILPLLVGGTWTSGELEPDLICNFFRLMADKAISVFTHNNCKTNSWTLSSSSGSPLLQLEWNIESTKFAKGAAGSFTSGLQFSNEPLFVHSRSTITIDGDVYKVDDVQIAGNNNLATDIYYNSQTRTDLAQGNQIFTFTHTSPFDTAGDVSLLDLGAASVSGSVEYVAGATGEYSLLIEFPALHAPVPTPITPAGNTPVRYEGLQWTARTVLDDTTVLKPIKFTLTLPA